MFAIRTIGISDASVCAFTFLLHTELFLNRYGDVEQNQIHALKMNRISVSKFLGNINKIYAVLI